MLMAALVLVAELFAGLPAEECEAIYKSTRYNWSAWARPKQRPPEGRFDVWALVAGRGSGKTRPGSEWTISKAKKHPGYRMAITARTAADLRDTIALGESGILACSPPWFRPRYYPTKRLILWPNGFEAHLYTADAPDLLRGPQHHFGWGDEFASWRFAEAWSNMQDGMRLGDAPEVLLTTTPRKAPLFLDTLVGPKDPVTNKRPISQEQIATGAWEFEVTSKDHRGIDVTHRTVVRRWRTEENANNLAPGFAAKRRAKYGDSSFGRQELDADVQEIVEGALWTTELLDSVRVEVAPARQRVVVCVDPSHSENGRNDACGIIVVALGTNGFCYVLADRSLNASPHGWGSAVIKAYDDFRADLVVYESNASPKHPHTVRDTIRAVDPTGRIKWFPVHSSDDKPTRADPVHSLYEQKRVWHLDDIDDRGVHSLAQLEHEMTSWDPWAPKAKSPNRVDALVHGVTYLMLGEQQSAIAAPVVVGTRPSPWRS